MRRFKLSRFLEPEYLRYLLDVLLRRPNVKNGLREYEPIGTDEIHFRGKNEVLGNAKTILRQTGDWIIFRSAGESQKREGADKMACVTFSAHNAIEEIINLFWFLVETAQANEEQREIVKVFIHFGLLKKVSDNPLWFEANVSDRYIAKVSGTTYRGNSQKNVADAIRKYGLVPEELWPWVDDWDEYYQNVDLAVVSRGQKLVDKETGFIEINYEWANPSLFKDSVTYAPPQTSGFGWNGERDGIYIRTLAQKNHAFVRDGYTDQYINVNDSYEPFDKKLAHNFNFGWDMLFTIHLKKPLVLYDQAEIDKVRKEKGWEYIVLVKDYSPEYTQGVYQLTDDGLKKLASADTVDEWVLAKKKDGKLEGVPPAWFGKLIT